MDTRNDDSFSAHQPGNEPADPAEAKKQSQGLTLVPYWGHNEQPQGLTLVPYWGHNEQGQRIACCAWIKLRPGESISEAAGRLSRAAST